MQEFTSFWMVWVEGSGPPSFKHWTEESAAKEADRLARIHKGYRVYVLHTVSACVHSEVQWLKAVNVIHESNQDVPF